MLNATWDQVVVGKRWVDVAKPEPLPKMLHLVSGDDENDRGERLDSSSERPVLIKTERLDDLLRSLRTTEFCGVVDPEGGHSTYLKSSPPLSMSRRNESMPYLASSKLHRKIIGARQTSNYLAHFKAALRKARSGPTLCNSYHTDGS